MKTEEFILRVLNTVRVAKSCFKQSEDLFEICKVVITKGDIRSDLSVSSSREAAYNIGHTLLQRIEMVTIHSQLLVYLRDELVKVFTIPKKLVRVRDSFGKAE